MAEGGINFMAMLNPQFAAQQQKFALQQQMAQQMMQEGSQQPPDNQLANPGGQVVPNSPWAALSRAVEKGTGAYVANKAIGDQLAAYQNMGNSNGITGSAAASNPLMPTQQELLVGQLSPEQGKAMYETRVAGIKAKNQAQGDTVTLPDGTVVPKSNIVGSADSSGSVTNTPSPAAPIPPTQSPPLAPDKAAQVDSLYGPNAERLPAQPVNITRPNANSPEGAANAAGLKAEATKQGENKADAAKSFAAINSTISTQLKNLEILKNLSARMPDRGPHETEVWLSKHLGNQDMSSADAQFNTMNKQMFVNGLMGSIPPGSRLDIPIVKALQAAKEVDPTLDNKSRLAVINSHIQTLKDAQQNAYANYGFQGGTPQPPTIASPASSAGVTHVWTPNGIQPVGER